MEWILAIAAFILISFVVQWEKKKAREEKRRQDELLLLKKIYERSDEDDHDTKGELLMIAESLLDPEYDLWLSERSDTRAWWHKQIKDSDERFTKFIGHLADIKENAKKED